jgi:hypothetical protein
MSAIHAGVSQVTGVVLATNPSDIQVTSFWASVA